ncbi:hypothetical protein AJ87_18380 [Rhizobium yanglingense]|nr:hypothetical protein AJ87_18380 [Rhizobium yanglingense]
MDVDFRFRSGDQPQPRVVEFRNHLTERARQHSDFILTLQNFDVAPHVELSAPANARDMIGQIKHRTNKMPPDHPEAKYYGEKSSPKRYRSEAPCQLRAIVQIKATVFDDFVDVFFHRDKLGS